MLQKNVKATLVSKQPKVSKQFSAKDWQALLNR